ncbi:MAG: DUF4437 domain-containing protein [Pseudomonadota bacterium]
MRLRSAARAVAAGAALAAVGAGAEPAPELAQERVARIDAALQPLNPLRGDASPKAAVLWGDIRQDVPTGALIEFAAGFSSPPHIHNVAYRAVVVRGEVHNDDPSAAVMWMGPGSYWTQPAGEAHVTSASAAGPSLAFLEIMSGPYLVAPAAEAFDSGERPINMAARNVVWLEAADVAWLRAETVGAGEAAAAAPRVAFLWGRPAEGARNGSFLELPSGFAGILAGGAGWLRAVLIRGRARASARRRTGGDACAGRLFRRARRA